MGLGMLSLKYLASRAVLLQDLDTRDLPLRLHKEMQQYRKLRGAFKIMSIRVDQEFFLEWPPLSYLHLGMLKWN